MFDRLVEAFGRIDLLVANAGIQKDSAITDMSLEDWRAVLDINLTGQFLCVREAIRRFLAQGPIAVSKATGKIICMSSVHELIPWAGHVNYAASHSSRQPALRSPSSMWAWSSGRIHGTRPRTYISNEPGAIAMAFSSASLASAV